MNKILFIYQSWIEIFKNIKYSNGATCICSAISIALFAGVRDNINERFKGRMPIPVPIELIIVRSHIRLKISIEKKNKFIHRLFLVLVYLLHLILINDGK